MLEKAQGQTMLPEFELYSGETYTNVGTIQTVLEDILEAARNGTRASSIKLEKDKSGQVTLSEKTPERITPLLIMTKIGEPKHSCVENTFHRQVMLINKLFDIRDEVKLPVIDTRATIFPPKLA